jgi:hypothetical protein
VGGGGGGARGGDKNKQSEGFFWRSTKQRKVGTEVHICPSAATTPSIVSLYPRSLVRMTLKAGYQGSARCRIHTKNQEEAGGKELGASLPTLMQHFCWKEPPLPLIKLENSKPAKSQTPQTSGSMKASLAFRGVLRSLQGAYILGGVSQSTIDQLGEPAMISSSGSQQSIFGQVAFK